MRDFGSSFALAAARSVLVAVSRLLNMAATNVLFPRGGTPKALIVLSMVGKNYRLTRDMKDAAAALNLPLADTAMILRQIYADAPGQGAVV